MVSLKTQIIFTNIYDLNVLQKGLTKGWTVRSGHSAEQFFKYRSGPERNIFPFRVKEYAFWYYLLKFHYVNVWKVLTTWPMIDINW